MGDVHKHTESTQKCLSQYETKDSGLLTYKLCTDAGNIVVYRQDY